MISKVEIVLMRLIIATIVMTIVLGVLSYFWATRRAKKE